MQTWSVCILARARSCSRREGRDLGGRWAAVAAAPTALKHKLCPTQMADRHRDWPSGTLFNLLYHLEALKVAFEQGRRVGSTRQIAGRWTPRCRDSALPPYGRGCEIIGPVIAKKRAGTQLDSAQHPLRNHACSHHLASRSPRRRLCEPCADLGVLRTVGKRRVCNEQHAAHRCILKSTTTLRQPALHHKAL